MHNMYKMNVLMIILFILNSVYLNPIKSNPTENRWGVEVNDKLIYKFDKVKVDGSNFSSVYCINDFGNDEEICLVEGDIITINIIELKNDNVFGNINIDPYEYDNTNTNISLLDYFIVENRTDNNWNSLLDYYKDTENESIHESYEITFENDEFSIELTYLTPTVIDSWYYYKLDIEGISKWRYKINTQFGVVVEHEFIIGNLTENKYMHVKYKLIEIKSKYRPNKNTSSIDFYTVIIFVIPYIILKKYKRKNNSMP